MKWTKEAVIKEIQKIAENGTASSQTNQALGTTAARIFGTWEDVCKQAGVSPVDRHAKNIPPQEIIDEIKKISVNGRAPSTDKTAKQIDPKLYVRAVKVFGSWKKAC